MARTLSLDLLNAMYSEETGEVVVALMELSHPSFPTKYFCSNPTTLVSTAPLAYKTVSNGIDYWFVPFTIQLPDDNDEQSPTTRFSIENISRDLIGEIRNVNIRQGRAKLSIKLALVSAPDDIEVEFPDFDVVSASFNMNAVVIEAQIDAMTEEPYPADTFSPAGFPALHGRTT